MASQHGSHNPSSQSQASSQAPGQAQMRRGDQPSDIHNQEQDSTFLQDTGSQIKNMAQGAAQGAVSMAMGAAAGAANLAHGAADAVKNTLGMNNADNPKGPNDSDHSGAANRNASHNPAGLNNPSSNPRI